MAVSFKNVSLVALLAVANVALNLMGGLALADSLEPQEAKKQPPQPSRRIVSTHAYAAFLASELARFGGKSLEASWWFRRAVAFEPELQQTPMKRIIEEKRVAQKAKVSKTKRAKTRAGNAPQVFSNSSNKAEVPGAGTAKK